MPADLVVDASVLAKFYFEEEGSERAQSLLTSGEVFAAPGSPLDPRAEGTNDLLRQGAAICARVEYVLAIVDPGACNPSGVALSIADPDRPSRYLEIRGRVERIVPDPAGAEFVRLAERYGMPQGPPSDAADRIAVAIRPRYTPTM